MRESTVEKYFKESVKRIGGVSYKFKSPSQRGVTDRIVCLPSGQTWFVELKRPVRGKLTMLQEYHAKELRRVNQKYSCLYSHAQVDDWIKNVTA